MSQGRTTQQLINASMIVTCGAALIGVALIATFQHRNLGYFFLAAAIVTSLAFLLFRCKACGLNVTREADGSRTRRSSWPRANPTCRNCGADIP